MAYPTPPPTNSNFKKFLEPMNKLTYYEDLYGKRNEDEELDRFPDDCKDESDCEDGVGRTAKSGIGRGFFSKYIEPRSKKKSTVLPGVNHFREVKKRNGQNIFSHLHNSGKLPTSNGDNRQYKIAPSINPKQSIKTSPAKKLAPKKLGFFSKSFAAMEGTNTAGEAMDDLLRAGGIGLGNLDDGFPTLDEDDMSYDDAIPVHEPSPTIDPTLLMEDAQRANVHRRLLPQNNVIVNGPESEAQKVSDGDVGDNSTDADDAKAAIKVMRDKRQPKAARQTSRQAATIDIKAQKPTLSTTGARYSTRNSSKATTATRPPTQTAAKTKAAKLKANNRKKMTARAATLHKKAKKKGVATKVPVDREQYLKTLLTGAGGRNVRLRNWKGDVIKEGNGIVVVSGDEEDADEYVRY